MRQKKVKLNALLLLGFGLTGLQAQSTMYVRQTSGVQTAYALSNIRKMSFSPGNISVSKATGSTDTYALNGIRYLNFQDLSTGIVETYKKDITMLLYPNPVVDLLNIQVSTKGSQAYVIEILSVEGKVVYQEKIKPQGVVYQINVSALPKGLYLCMINNGITTETTKFLKQ